MPIVNQPRRPLRGTGNNAWRGASAGSGAGSVTGNSTANQSKAGAQHFLYLMPEPHGHTSLHPGFGAPPAEGAPPPREAASLRMAGPAAASRARGGVRSAASRAGPTGLGPMRLEPPRRVRSPLRCWPTDRHRQTGRCSWTEPHPAVPAHPGRRFPRLAFGRRLLQHDALRRRPQHEALPARHVRSSTSCGMRPAATSCSNSAAVPAACAASAAEAAAAELRGADAPWGHWFCARARRQRIAHGVAT